MGWGVGGRREGSYLGSGGGVLVEPEAPPAVAGEDVVQVLGPTGHVDDLPSLHRLPRACGCHRRQR